MTPIAVDGQTHTGQGIDQGESARGGVALSAGA
jgi:hypothetical protein